MSKKDKRGNFGWIILLTVIGVLWMIPFVFMVSMSFRSADQAFEPVLFTLPITIKNYILVIKQNPLALNFYNSFVVTTFTVIFVSLFASMAAFGLTRKHVKGKKVLYSILLLGLMVPISVLVIPIAQIDSSFGMMNRFIGLIFPYTALGIPFGLVIMKGFVDEFPMELEEAATVDGCSIHRLFFTIVLPFLRPGIIVVAIWQFLTSWNEFFLALTIMTDKSKKLISLVPMQYKGFYFSQPGALFAILVLITIPTIVFYILLQRKFVSGLISGAIKG